MMVKLAPRLATILCLYQVRVGGLQAMACLFIECIPLVGQLEGGSVRGGMEL